MMKKLTVQLNRNNPQILLEQLIDETSTQLPHAVARSAFRGAFFISDDFRSRI